MKRSLLPLAVIGMLGCQGNAHMAVDRQPVQPSGPGDELPEVPGPGPSPEDPFVPPVGNPASPDACEGITVTASPTSLRRLTVEEQRNSFRDVLADPALNPALAPAAGPVITEGEVEKLNLAVAALVQKQGHLAYLPCDAAGAFNTGCADAFIAAFGEVAFRRPLTAAEKQWLRRDVFDAIRAHPQLSPAATFREAIDSVAQAMLQSPQLLYVHETGVADPALPAGIRRLSGHERAARLSFLLWRTTPDKTLLAAAAAGQLDTADGVRAQAARLLASPRAKDAVRSFVSSWLALDGNSHQASLEAAPKSATAFPFDSPTLRKAMREELLSLYEQVFFAPGSSFSSLMTSPKAYVNRTLGQLYGVASPPANDTTFAWVDLDPAQRAGLFTRAGFLSLYAPQETKSPIRRGVFLVRDALCQPLGAPPADVDNTPLKPTGTALSVREQVHARTGSTSCQACHSRIDPLGFTLENYDAIGRYEVKEKGVLNGTPYEVPVDAIASPVGTDFDGVVDGPLALATKLGQSGMAHDCVATTWYRQAHARPLNAVDACSLQKVMRQFRTTDDMRELVLAIASDDSALFIQETP